MPLIQPDQPLVIPKLVPEMQLDVAPKAVDAMSRAFRTGFITGDEIAERFTERDALKRKLEAQKTKSALELEPEELALKKQELANKQAEAAARAKDLALPGSSEQPAMAGSLSEAYLKATGKLPPTVIDPTNGQKVLDVAEMERAVGQEIEWQHLLAMAKVKNDSKSLTEFQGKSATYAARMAQANSTFGAMKKRGVDMTSTWSSLQQSRLFPNAARDKDMQDLVAAKGAFITAALRQESGAAISKDEFFRYSQFFFPNWGDAPEVAEEKDKRRQLAMNMMHAASNPDFRVPADATAFQALVEKFQFDPSQAGAGATPVAPAVSSAPAVSGGTRPAGVPSDATEVKPGYWYSPSTSKGYVVGNPAPAAAPAPEATSTQSSQPSVTAAASPPLKRKTAEPVIAPKPKRRESLSIAEDYQP